MRLYNHFLSRGGRVLALSELPKGYGWVSSGWHNGAFYNYFMTDKDLNEGQDRNAIICRMS